MATGCCGQGHILGTLTPTVLALLPCTLPALGPTHSTTGPLARLWGCCSAGGCVKGGMSVPFRVSLGAVCMAESRQSRRVQGGISLLPVPEVGGGHRARRDGAMGFFFWKQSWGRGHHHFEEDTWGTFWVPWSHLGITCPTVEGV